MANFFRKGKVKKIVAIVLGLVAVAGAVFGVSALAKYAKEEQKTIKPTFSVGGLTETGVYEETDDTIYTKDSFEAKGLEIKLDFDSNVKYQVFFYDELDKFISCTEVYTESQDIRVPICPVRARLEITPIWGADAPLEKEIKWYETAKYANQVEIRVDKRQELLEKDFTAYKFTESDRFTLHEGKSVSLTSGILEESAKNTYEFTVLENYSKMYIRFPSDYVFSQQQVLQLKSGDSIRNFYPSDLRLLSIDNLIDVKKGDILYFMYLPVSEDVSELALMFCFL